MASHHRPARDASSFTALTLLALALIHGLQAGPASAQLASAVQRAAIRAASQQAARRQAARAVQHATTRRAVDRVTATWTNALCKPSRVCPLPEHVGNTFRGGTYHQVTLGQDTQLHRVYSDPANRLGTPGALYSYWSRDPAMGRRAVIDRAIPVSTNGNVADKYVTIRLPRGSVVYEGKAAGLPRGPVGGGNQVVIDWVKLGRVE